MKRVFRFASAAAVVAVISLVGGATDAFACRLGVGDRVWFDANRNGIQDNGEPGINGITVRISPGYYSNLLDPNSYVDSMVTASGAGGDGYICSARSCATSITRFRWTLRPFPPVCLRR